MLCPHRARILLRITRRIICADLQDLPDIWIMVKKY